MQFLGHRITQNGIETDPEKIDKIKDAQLSLFANTLLSFVAFCGYYRRFVKDFAKITKPLREPLKVYEKNEKLNGETDEVFDLRNLLRDRD